MVTPEIVGHIDPAGWSGAQTNQKPEIDSPITLAVDLCLVRSMTTANLRALLDS
jgi:hypothetical protein